MATSSGYGYGYGYGYGFGEGTGLGTGDGAGACYGYGSSYGGGHGHGTGEVIATIGEYKVRVHSPFAVVSVGCQTHTLSEWQERWKEIAAEHGVDVTQEQVDKILSEVE